MTHDTPTTTNLRRDWEERARSSMGRFFVASHPGWNDPSTWRSTAARDAEFALLGLDRGFLRAARTLEIGCGVGRLVPHFAPLVAQYVGIDLCATYLEEARQEGAALDNTAFHLSDGAAIPDALAGQSFDLILAIAVFIHCPFPVIDSLLRAGIAQLDAQGVFRFQLLADPDDPHGYLAPPEGPAVAEEVTAPAVAAPAGADQLAAMRQEMGEAGLLHLTDERSYQGHQFSVEAARGLCQARAPGRRTTIVRFEPFMLHIEIGPHA